VKTFGFPSSQAVPRAVDPDATRPRDEAKAVATGVGNKLAAVWKVLRVKVLSFVSRDDKSSESPLPTARAEFD
jgi:hypothetical protein